MFSLNLLELYNGNRKCQDKWLLHSGQLFGSCSLDNCWTNIAWGGEALHGGRMEKLALWWQLQAFSSCLQKFCCCPNLHTPAHRTNTPTQVTRLAFSRRLFLHVLCGVQCWSKEDYQVILSKTYSILSDSCSGK